MRGVRKLTGQKEKQRDLGARKSIEIKGDMDK